ncbi:MAG: rRNA maturation RNase YbeY [Chloroflexi bacterium RBG_19FT_COMBO_49_13]|nr:MAG: rRNA maturation RNase YbeY [Chloroflexi bacterium RBG_16_47_49]OGO61099.1 MAG: rRNA maturation RNase YbeY [Chloroflexi bacterium RBG_19FT_COMBO_49_13]
MNLQVKRTVKLPVDKSILLHAAQLTLDLENTSPGSEMSVVIGDDSLLKRLNYKFRQLNTTTDVLSFPSSEPDPDTNLIYLGDVVISLPRAQEQANSDGHPLVDELQLLVVHGTLHLIGYDHLERTDKKKMQAAQDIVLTQLGVSLESIL